MPSPGRTKPSSEAPDLDQLVATTATRVADRSLAALRSMFSEQAIRGVIEREAKIAVQGALLAELERMRGTPQPSPAPARQQDLQRPLAYRPKEAAALIGISRATLYTLIASGSIKARKFGGGTLISRSDLEAYLDGLPSLPGGRR